MLADTSGYTLRWMPKSQVWQPHLAFALLSWLLDALLQYRTYLKMTSGPQDTKKIRTRRECKQLALFCSCSLWLHSLRNWLTLGNKTVLNSSFANGVSLMPILSVVYCIFSQASWSLSLPSDYFNTDIVHFYHLTSISIHFFPNAHQNDNNTYLLVQAHLLEKGW